MASKQRSGAIPLSPLQTRVQISATWRPSEVTAPKPVTTTRRFMDPLVQLDEVSLLVTAFLMWSTACPTVWIFSAASSGI